jgi:hypothetical protein
MKRLIFVLFGVAALAAAPMAEAVPITGGISFIGDATASGGTDWATATGIDFTGCSLCTGANAGKEAIVENTSGSYAGTGGTFVDFTDFTFDPALSPDPVTVWTFTSGGLTYSFVMDEVQVDSQGTGLGGQTFLNLSGAGTLFITGFDPTPGFFLFTGNESGGVFSVSSSSFAEGDRPVDIEEIPEPGTMLLLGIGLVALGIGARRRVRTS